MINVFIPMMPEGLYSVSRCNSFFDNIFTHHDRSEFRLNVITSNQKNLSLLNPSISVSMFENPIPFSRGDWWKCLLFHPRFSKTEKCLFVDPLAVKFDGNFFKEFLEFMDCEFVLLHDNYRADIDNTSLIFWDAGTGQAKTLWNRFEDVKEHVFNEVFQNVGGFREFVKTLLDAEELTVKYLKELAPRNVRVH